MLNVFSFGNAEGVGGVHTWNVRFAGYFSQNPCHGVRWTVVEAADSDTLAKLRASVPDSVSANYRLIELTASQNPFADAQKLLKALPELRCADIVIPNLSATGYLVWDYLRRTTARVPAVIGVLHSDEEFYYRLCSNAVVGSHELVVAVSAACEKEFARRRPGVTLETIPYGVEVPEQLPMKSVSGKIHIAYVGRIIQHQKRILDLVNVARELVNLRAPFELHLLGDGRERQELQTRLAAVAPNQVTFHGPLPLPAVLQFLRDKAHVSILVSEWEGTSLTMLEAMANGVVPVVTDVRSGSCEAIQQGVDGWRVPVGDARAMAEVVATLSRDHHLLSRVAAHAHETARERYALETCARRWTEAMRLAATKPRGAIEISRAHFGFGRLQRPGIPAWLIGSARKARKAVSASGVSSQGR